MKELIGKQVKGIRVNTNATLLAFNVGGYNVAHGDPKWITYQTESGCCSECWFQELIGVRSLIGWAVISADEIDSVYAPGTRQHHDRIYGVKITTSQGVCDVGFRTSSHNGQYGGEISRRTSFAMDEIIEMADLLTWTDITNDWEASE